MDQEQQAVDKLYKTHFGKMVTAMLQFSRDIDLETAEDLVQDAFYAALAVWKDNGIPDNPAGWMYRVCRNNAINALKKHKTFKNPFEEDGAINEETGADEGVFDDSKMQLLFACAHPRLSAKMQVVVTLKYVVNLRAESIAKALGMTVDGIDKTLARAKERIRMENIFLKAPAPLQLKARLAVVHKIIYLVFNEGYRAGSGKEIIRQELCEESLIMMKCLLDNHICNSETTALYALLLFNAARLNARLAPGGGLLDLAEQDRGLWNGSLIALGSYYLRQAETGNLSSYHYEAAIACLHCHAKSFADTDWATIEQLYSRILQNNPNPFIELNHAIALYYASHKQTAFEVLHGLQKTFLEKSYLLHAALGKLYLLENEHDKSSLHFTKALDLTNFKTEKDFVKKLLAKKMPLP
ncbi:MAG TPA: sigma-70 family RNA polymerase sigma factor [Chitinophagaceae bacterium]|nr:sigma-70 family RNA polymerase sigma factor [Chitinophagaceae bacterium]